MSLTNKLFSLLGFAEPIALKRCNGTNQLPNNIGLVSIHEQVNMDIQQAILALKIETINDVNDISEKSIEGLIIDATSYSGEHCYHKLFVIVQGLIKYITNNARIVFLVTAESSEQTPAQNAFTQAIIGFGKSLAKEVGRKGSTVNIISIENWSHEYISKAIVSPLTFLLSPKSAFVSGQTITVDCQKEYSKRSLKEESLKKVAIVTGAAQGIGAAIASKLYENGYLVIGIDIQAMATELANTMNKLEGVSFCLDVSDNNAGDKLVALANQYNGFDLVVHNAGITRDKTLSKMPEHYWKQTLDINLLSVMNINKALLENNSINQAGSIVCLSSMNGIAGQGGQTNYACSKAGIIGYVKGMKNELATKSITINAVAPGFIETKMTEKIPFFTREMGRRLSALGQGGLPVDVAETVTFLGSNTSFAVSGQTIRVCGLNIIGS